jgi:two-component sensor histidine kinase
MLPVAVRKLIDRLQRVWRFGVRPASPEAFGFALACVAGATLVRILADVARPDSIAHATYYPAVLLATLVGGAWAGGLAMVLGAIVAWWAFEPPFFTFALLKPDQAIDLFLYLVSSSVIIWTADKYRTVLRRLDEERHLRELVVDELGHRVKNKLAIVHAILAHELRRDPDLWRSVDSRLRALAATDDVIARSEGRHAAIGDLLVAEFAPYDTSRIRLHGEEALLAPKLAVTLALIFHELATNAAKYGALSVPGGTVAVSWATGAGRMTIDWTECGGPPAPPPARQGFGMRLLARGLDPFHGRVDTRFGPGGLACRIMVAIPDPSPERLPATTLAPHS